MEVDDTLSILSLMELGDSFPGPLDQMFAINNYSPKEFTKEFRKPRSKRKTYLPFSLSSIGLDMYLTDNEIYLNESGWDDLQRIANGGVVEDISNCIPLMDIWWGRFCDGFASATGIPKTELVREPYIVFMMPSYLGPKALLTKKEVRFPGRFCDTTAEDSWELATEITDYMAMCIFLGNSPSHGIDFPKYASVQPYDVFRVDTLSLPSLSDTTRRWQYYCQNKMMSQAVLQSVTYLDTPYVSCGMMARMMGLSSSRTPRTSKRWADCRVGSDIDFNAGLIQWLRGLCLSPKYQILPRFHTFIPAIRVKNTAKIVSSESEREKIKVKGDKQQLPRKAYALALLLCPDSRFIPDKEMVATQLSEIYEDNKKGFPRALFMDLVVSAKDTIRVYTPYTAGVESTFFIVREGKEVRFDQLESAPLWASGLASLMIIFSRTT